MSKNKDEKGKEVMTVLFALGRTLRDRCPKHDPFTILKFEVLRYLSQTPKAKMKDLADYLAITAPSATSLVDTLVESRLLKRVADTKDRRAVNLELTETGRKMIEIGDSRICAETSKLLKNLNNEEVDSLIRIIKKILNVQK